MAKAAERTRLMAGELRMAAMSRARSGWAVIVATLAGFGFGPGGGTTPIATARAASDSTARERQPVVTFRDDFNGTLASGWTWVRENPHTWHLNSDCLSIHLETGGLIRGSNDCRNLLIRPVGSRDFIVEARLEGYFAAKINQAMIVLYRDDDDYLRCGLGRWYDDRLRLLFVHETGGQIRAQPADLPEWRSATLWVRIVKEGPKASFLCCADGVSWQPMAEIADLGFEPTHVGLVAFEGRFSANASFAFYDYFEVREYVSASEPRSEPGQVGPHKLRGGR